MTHGSSQAPGAYGAASLGALVAGGARPKLVPVAPRADAAASEAAPPRTPQPPRTRGAALASPPFGASAASPAGAAAAGAATPGAAPPFAARAGRGALAAAHNAAAASPAAPAAAPARGALALAAGQAARPARALGVRLADAGAALAAAADAAAARIAAAGAAGAAAGRACVDALAPGARLNAQSLALELAGAGAGGARVPVALAPLAAAGRGAALFPGQIVGVVAAAGAAGGRGPLRAARIVHPPPPPAPATPLAELAALYPPPPPDAPPALRAALPPPLHVVVAAGPFTLDSDLDFEPLEALAAEVVAVDPPDLVVLLGPFVDIDHPLIAAGIVGSDVDEIFAAQVAPRLDRMRQARPGLQIALVPSARDACSEWIAFPQPPLAAALSPADAWARRDALGLLAPTPDRPGAKAPKDGIFLFPNPVQFRFNEIVFAVSSTDILFDLAAAECAIAPRAAPDAASQPLLASDAQLPPGSSPLGGVSQARAAAAAASASIAAGDAANDPDGDDDDDDAAQAAIDDDSLERSDKISRMFGHLLRQRSFYPLFPPAPSACLDLSRALALTTTDADGSELPGPLVLQAVPDVFIIPSRLHPVVRPVASALCINPGFLAKGRAAGTYARMCIHPLRIDAADAADADTAVEHAVPQRTAVEIRRI